MKRACLSVVLGLVLAATSGYAQMIVRGGSMGNAPVGIVNGGSIIHLPPVHVEPAFKVMTPVQRGVGEPQSLPRPGVGENVPENRRGFMHPENGGDRRTDFHGRAFGHGRGTVVFVYGVPYYCYPSYGYPGFVPTDATDSSVVYTTDPGTQTAQYVNQDTDAYYQPGYQWGGELKLYHVTMDQFVTYLKSYILGASPEQQAAFRSGFMAQFGPDGQVMYDQATQQASQQN